MIKKFIIFQNNNQVNIFIILMSIIYSNTCFWCPFFHCVWSISLFTLDGTLPSLCFLAVHGFSFIYISITIRILNQSWFTAQKVPECGKIRTRKNSLFRLFSHRTSEYHGVPKNFWDTLSVFLILIYYRSFYTLFHSCRFKLTKIGWSIFSPN